MNLRKPEIKNKIWYATENFSSGFLECLNNNTNTKNNIYSTTLLFLFKMKLKGNLNIGKSIYYFTSYVIWFPVWCSTLFSMETGFDLPLLP